MPTTCKKEESRLATLERLNPTASLIPLNKRIEVYLENFQGNSKHYTSQTADKYRHVLEAEIIKRKKKISQNNNNLAWTPNENAAMEIKSTKEKKVDATKEIFLAIKPMAAQVGFAAAGPAGALVAPLIVDRAHERVQQVKKAVRGAAQLLNEPSIRKTTARVAAAAGAVAAGGAVAGVLAPIMADTAQSLTQGAINASFSGITGTGILGTIISPVVNATSSAVGSVVGTTAGIMLPLALLYIAVPQLYKLFFWGMNKAVDALTKNRNTFIDLSLLPDQGPLLELICNLSTLSSIKKLDTELKLKGVANVKFNISQIFKKITNPDKEKLNQTDEALYQLAKKNAEKLIKLSEKALNKSKKLTKYRNLPETQKLILSINPFILEDELTPEMLFCLSITGALISEEKIEIQQAFFHALESSLRTQANHSDSYSVDSWTTNHTYDTVHSVKPEQGYENVPSKFTPYIYENTARTTSHSSCVNTQSGASARRTPKEDGCRSKFASPYPHYTPLEYDSARSKAAFFQPVSSRHGSATPSQTDITVSQSSHCVALSHPNTSV